MSRAPVFRAYPGELVVDNFAGGGGASTGIEAAVGRPCDIAINHDPQALAMHRANHPETRHYCENIWEVDPIDACAGKPVGLAWFSPDCKHFSKAKGGKPKEAGIRGLAWVVVKWARKVHPRTIILENVEDFATWGPLDDDGRPIKARAGETFRHWLGCLEAEGYRVELRELRAADYGAPTTRNRLYIIARLDRRMAWPDPTHGDGREHPHRIAAECIDWTIPAPSIFERSRPLAENTYRRIADGIRRYVLGDVSPFIVRTGHYFAGKPTTFRGQPLDRPLGTVCATNDKNLIVPFVTKHYGGVVGHRVTRPLGTVTAKDHHALTSAYLRRVGIDPELPEDRRTDHHADARAFLLKYYGTATGQNAGEPLHTVTSKARFGLVEIHGHDYRIVDVGMRMLQPRELFAAQGFPGTYAISEGVTDTGARIPLTKTNQIRMAGNSVAPPVARALVDQIISTEG